VAWLALSALHGSARGAGLRGNGAQHTQRGSAVPAAWIFVSGYFGRLGCGILMLVLFVVGVMNLLWIAVLAGFVFVEKLLPAGRLTAKFAGTALIVIGLIVLADTAYK
jgi:predicted metal-binding membrane protein